MVITPMSYSKEGLALTEHFEADGGPKLSAYYDTIGNVWTIGYGHTGSEVKKGLTWTAQHAVDILLVDIQWASAAVNTLLLIQPTQGEFDALVDFTFNEGVGNLKRSTLLRDFNAGNKSACNADLDKWIYGGGRVVPGLLRRRQAEGQLFNEENNADSQ